MRTPLDIALAHLRRHPDDFLFPLAPLSKFPPLLRRNLSENCSNDPAQIKSWARKFPNCNFGIALRRSRLIVPDVDVSKGKPGLLTYDLLQMLYSWPITQRVRSPSGGFHSIYRGQHIMRVAGFGPSVDSPNYIVCPGMPVKGGKSYRYVNALPRAEAPPWFYQVLGQKMHDRVTNASEAVVELDQPHNVADAIHFLQHDAMPAIEGSGGEFRTMLTAMALRDLGISEDRALDLVLDHYNERCSPPWEYDGLKQKISNGYAYASIRPIGGDTAEADFAGDVVEPFEAVNPDRNKNFVTVGRYKYSVTRTPRSPTKKRIK
jgi:hypothetical protein